MLDHAGAVRDLVAAVGVGLTDELSARPPMSRDDERALALALIGTELDRMANRALSTGQDPLTDGVEQHLKSRVIERLFGLGPLQPLLEMDEISNIHIPGADPVWVKYVDGRKELHPPVVDSDAELIELITTAAGRLDRTEKSFDKANWEVDLQLPNGDRLHAITAVSSRPHVTIRRHNFELSHLDDLVELNTIDPRLRRFLAAAVKARLNIVISGGPDAGKTTLLRCLINEIPEHERLITIEDNLELGLERFAAAHPDYETLVARRSNTEDAGEVTLAELVRAGLRMNPDRVIVGEVRGDELLPMLLAMSQGNDGSLCTIHASSSKDVFSRFAMYGALLPQQLTHEATNLLVANAVHLIVHVDWAGEQRVVTSIREVVAVDDNGQLASNELFRPGPDGSAVPGFPATDATRKRLAEHGYDDSGPIEGWSA